MVAHMVRSQSFLFGMYLGGKAGFAIVFVVLWGGGLAGHRRLQTRAPCHGSFWVFFCYAVFWEALGNTDLSVGTCQAPL